MAELFKKIKTDKMKFTEEEIKEGEELIAKFYWGEHDFIPTPTAIQFAIIAQKMKVESINEVLSILMLHDVYDSKAQGIFNNAKRVLQYLESL